MKITIVSFAMVAAFGLISCDNTKHNTLTEQEKAEGWELLFDGETLDGWRDYNGNRLDRTLGSCKRNHPSGRAR